MINEKELISNNMFDEVTAKQLNLIEFLNGSPSVFILQDTTVTMVLSRLVTSQTLVVFVVTIVQKARHLALNTSARRVHLTTWHISQWRSIASLVCRATTAKTTGWLNRMESALLGECVTSVFAYFTTELTGNLCLCSRHCVSKTGVSHVKV